MDRLEQYRSTLETVLNEHAQLAAQVRAEHPNAPDTPAETIAICDPKTDNYLLITTGWTSKQRIHSILAHFRIINASICIEWNGIENLIEDLIDRGIPATAFLQATAQHPPRSTALQ
ncbi:element excision factor XisI family protein [Prochlorothrix hollandica]|uniref:XisI protein n=1 Tax=Prochlorothrix hollandica PCC 9006 = CALU 1027 TaxID=317619 RepID=A0A0M2Q2B1_PROHO|nr:element excision factor XisI family protein [Prochlorothrix hollandica]KKJ00757.1 hypothetical protein PROH_05705 [Prochlorothrix hollandica PCC 9006 = CALU 1027]